MPVHRRPPTAYLENAARERLGLARLVPATQVIVGAGGIPSSEAFGSPTIVTLGPAIETNTAMPIRVSKSVRIGTVVDNSVDIGMRISRGAAHSSAGASSSTRGRKVGEVSAPVTESSSIEKRGLAEYYFVENRVLYVGGTASTATLLLFDNRWISLGAGVLAGGIAWLQTRRP